MQDFEKLLEGNHVLHPCVVLGDMNNDLSRQSAISKAYINLFLSPGFKQMVTQPKKMTVLSELCLDHLLTNDHNIITRVLKTDVSDHFRVLHETNFIAETKTAKKEALTFRTFHKALKNDNYFCKFLLKLLHELQKVYYIEENLDELFEKLSRTLKRQLDMYFPETTSQPVERRPFVN